MTDVVLGIKLTIDGKEVAGEIRGQTAELEKLGRVAQQSNQQAKTAADNYVASLKKQADTLGMTKSQTQAYEASQHNLTTAQREQVATNIKAIEAHDRHEKILGRVRLAAAAAGAALAAGLVAGLKASVAAAIEAEQADLRLLAVVRATGHAAGLTARELIEMAGAMQDRLGINDEAVKQSMAILLTFRSVSRESFGEAMEVAANLAKVTGTDLQSAVLQLGKALEEPEAGLTALRRSGVSFNETQKEMIKELVETGNQAQAITMILQVMREQGFDKVAESMHQGLGRETARLRNEWDDFLETLGRTKQIEAGVGGPLGLVATRLRELRELIELPVWQRLGVIFSFGAYSPPKPITSSSGVDVEDRDQGLAVRAVQNAQDAHASFMKQFLPDKEKLAKDLATLDSLYTRANGSLEQYAKDRAAILAKYAKKSPQGDGEDMEAYVARLREQLAVTKETSLEEKVLYELQTKRWKNDTQALREQAVELARRQALRKNEDLLLQTELALQKEAADEQRVRIQLAERANQLRNEALDSSRLALQAANDELAIAQKEIELMGLSEAARREQLALFKAEIDARNEINAKIAQGAQLQQEDIDKIYERGRASAAIRAQAETLRQEFAAMQGQQADMWRSIDRVAHDTFSSIEDSGKSAFDRLRDALKNGLYDLLYQMTVRRWIINVSAAVSGQSVASQAFGAANVAGGGGGFMGGGTGGMGIMDMLSLGNSASSLFSGGGMFAGATNLIGNSIAGASYLGTGSMFGAVGGAELAGLAALEGGGALAGGAAAVGAEMALAAIPYIGWAIAAIALIASMSGSDKIPTSALGGFTGTFDPEGIVSGQGSIYGGDTTGAKSVVKGMYQRFDMLAQALGGTYDRVHFAYDSNTGKDGQNPNFALSSQVAGRQYVVGEHVGTIRKLDDATIQLEVGRALVSALQGADLPRYIEDYFDKLNPALMDQAAVDNALAFAGALKALRDALYETRSPLEIMRDNMRDLGKDLHTSRRDYEEDLKAAIKKGLTPETLAQWQQLTELINQVTAAEVQLAATRQDLIFQFSSPGRQLDMQRELIDRTFRRLDIEAPETRGEFRRLVEGLDLSTKSGQDMLNALLAIAPAFQAVTETAKEAREEVDRLALREQHRGARGSLIDMVRGLPDALGITSLLGFRNSLRVSDTLSPENQIENAQAQYNATLRRAQRGNLAAIEALPGIAQQYLTIGRDAYASGSDFQAIYRAVMRDTNAVIAAQRDVQSDLLREIPRSIVQASNDQVFELKGMRQDIRRLVELFRETRRELQRVTRVQPA